MSLSLCSFLLHPSFSPQEGMQDTAYTTHIVLFLCYVSWAQGPIRWTETKFLSWTFRDRKSLSLMKLSVVPILQSHLSVLIPKSMFKGFSPCIPTVSTLYFSLFNPLHYSPLLLFSHLPLYNSLQYILLYPLPTQMKCISILFKQWQNNSVILFSFLVWVS
jgi:hypothetical protein